MISQLDYELLRDSYITLQEESEVDRQKLKDIEEIIKRADSDDLVGEIKSILER